MLTKAQKQFNRGRIIFSTNDVGAIGCLGKKKKTMLNPQFIQKATPKWIVDLNVRYKTIKFLEKKKMREKFWDLMLRQRVLRHDTKITIYKGKKPMKLDIIKTKSFPLQKMQRT